MTSCSTVDCHCMYSTLPNCLKSSCWTFITMQMIPSCIWVYYLMKHLWPSSVWTRASSTLKPGLKPAAWDWTRPRHKSCGSGQDNSWPRWILMRCHYWHRESMSSMLREISALSLTASCLFQHRFQPFVVLAITSFGSVRLFDTFDNFFRWLLQLRRYERKYSVSKNIPNIFSCNLRQHCRIFIIFGTHVNEKVSKQ